MTDWRNQVLEGDALAILGEIPDNYVDSIVSDPPSGISFMGLKWDSNKGGRDKWIAWLQEIAQEAMRVIKPGGHALIWSLPRTSHWTAMAWENAGWEVRDRIAFCFATGFPKSANVQQMINKAERGHPQGSVDPTSPNHGKFKGGCSNENEKGQGFGAGAGSFMEEQGKGRGDDEGPWQGWGTALKPAIEDWWLFRKPLSEKTIAANVLKWGVGGINVDGSRIQTGDSLDGGSTSGSESCTDGWDRPWKHDPEKLKETALRAQASVRKAETLGRFPSHLIHDGSDEIEACFPDRDAGGNRSGNEPSEKTKNCYGKYGRIGFESYADTGSASRFFFAAKPSPSERGKHNNHATVKCLALMRYLTRLITPPGGICLDMFAGSGTTGMACKHEGFQWILVEQDKNSCEIAKRRIKEEAVQLNAFAELARKKTHRNFR